MLDCPLNCTNIGYFRTSQLSLAHRIAVCVRRLVSLFCAHTHATNPHGGECLFFLLSRSSTDTATTTILLRRLTLVPSRQGVVSNKHFCHIQEEARNRISPPCLFKQKFVYILFFCGFSFGIRRSVIARVQYLGTYSVTQSSQAQR